MIIGISGKIGSGKDTLAEMLIRYNHSFEQKRFADKLKLITSILASCAPNDCYSQEGKNKKIEGFDMTIGQMQQVIGTEVMRSWDNDVWIKALFSGYKSDLEGLPLPNWIISDVRFKNEAAYIKNKGGILIRLEGDPAKIRQNSTRDMTHVSETDLDDYDGFNYTYANTGTLSDLCDFSIKVLNGLVI